MGRDSFCAPPASLESFRVCHVCVVCVSYVCDVVHTKEDPFTDIFICTTCAPPPPPPRRYWYRQRWDMQQETGESRHTREWVLSHKSIHHAAHVNVSRCTCECVMPRRTCECVTSLIWMNGVTLSSAAFLTEYGMSNVSCQTCV